MILQAHPLSSAPFAFARLGFFRDELFGMLLLPGHVYHPFRSGSGQVAQKRYSLEGNRPGMLAQAVTTVWRTQLGTMLSNGFNSTTVLFGLLSATCACSILQCAADS